MRTTRAPAWGSIGCMFVLADVGAATVLLESIATSMVAGTVVIGFLTAGREVLLGRSHRTLEVKALPTTFQGDLVGCFCLLYDLVVR